ncbi:hypothetical protein BVX93_00505 [bacterium B13(2017)]|nr:hypothetical protein BVX93_00505 [bacterium B13(2017)]
MDENIDFKIWKKNCDLLEKVYPEIAKSFITDYSFYSKKVKFQKNPKGALYATFFLGDSYRPLHSKYDPNKEAKRFIEHLDIENLSNVVLLGLGLGYTLYELLEHKDELNWILVIEGDLLSFWAYCHLFDISTLFKTSKLSFLLQPSKEYLFSFLQSYSLSILANGMKMIRYPSIYQLAKDYYFQIEQKIDALSKWARANVLTQVRAANIFSKNIFMNLETQINSIPFKVFENQFKNIPAIIVAGGPSLNKNGYLLKAVKGKALIFAVDTVLSFLSENGIVPDFIVSTDFTKNAKGYFEKQKNGEAILLADPEVCFDIISYYKGPICFCDIEGKAILEWVREFIGDYGILPKGISVAHTAFSAAFFCGADPIIFVGQDLSYSKDRTHVKGTPHGVHIQADDKHYLTIQGMFGPVKTSNSLKVFLDHFEDMFLNIDRTIIDATEGGATIKGTQNKTFREVLIDLSNPVFKLKEKIDELITGSKKNISHTEFLKFMQNGSQNLNSLIHLIEKIQKQNYILDNLIQSKINEKEILVENYKKYKNLIVQLSKYNKTLDMLRDNMLEAYVLKAKHIKHKLSEQNVLTYTKKMRQILQTDYTYYNHIKNAANVLKNQIFEIINTCATNLKN